MVVYNLIRRMQRYEITDEQWDKIKSYFESKKGRPYKNVRNTLNGIVLILKSGAAFRYGSWNAVYKCFSKWQETGLFEKIFKDSALECDLQGISIACRNVSFRS